MPAVDTRCINRAAQLDKLTVMHNGVRLPIQFFEGEAAGGYNPSDVFYPVPGTYGPPPNTARASWPVGHDIYNEPHVAFLLYVDPRYSATPEALADAMFTNLQYMNNTFYGGNMLHKYGMVIPALEVTSPALWFIHHPSDMYSSTIVDGPFSAAGRAANISTWGPTGYWGRFFDRWQYLCDTNSTVYTSIVYLDYEGTDNGGDHKTIYVQWKSMSQWSTEVINDLGETCAEWELRHLNDQQGNPIGAGYDGYDPGDWEFADRTYALTKIGFYNALSQPGGVAYECARVFNVPVINWNSSMMGSYTHPIQLRPGGADNSLAQYEYHGDGYYGLCGGACLPCYGGPHIEANRAYSNYLPYDHDVRWATYYNWELMDLFAFDKTGMFALQRQMTIGKLVTNKILHDSAVARPDLFMSHSPSLYSAGANDFDSPYQRRGPIFDEVLGTGATDPRDATVLTFSSGVDGGTYTLTAQGHTTSAIAYNASNATISAAMTSAGMTGFTLTGGGANGIATAALTIQFDTGIAIPINNGPAYGLRSINFSTNGTTLTKGGVLPSGGADYLIRSDVVIGSVYALASDHVARSQIYNDIMSDMISESFLAGDAQCSYWFEHPASLNKYSFDDLKSVEFDAILDVVQKIRLKVEAAYIDPDAVPSNDDESSLMNFVAGSVLIPPVNVQNPDLGLYMEAVPAEQFTDPTSGGTFKPFSPSKDIDMASTRSREQEIVLNPMTQPSGGFPADAPAPASKTLALGSSGTSGQVNIQAKAAIEGQGKGWFFIPFPETDFKRPAGLRLTGYVNDRTDGLTSDFTLSQTIYGVRLGPSGIIVLDHLADTSFTFSSPATKTPASDDFGGVGGWMASSATAAGTGELTAANGLVMADGFLPAYLKLFLPDEYLGVAVAAGIGDVADKFWLSSQRFY